jgi:hypothetical protein
MAVVVPSSRGSAAFAALAVLFVQVALPACGSSTGLRVDAGSSTAGAAGSAATGAAGSSTAGAAGSTATGAAGSTATGAAGSSATGAAGSTATGAAGSTSGGAGLGAAGAAGGASGGAGLGAAGARGDGGPPPLDCALVGCGETPMCGEACSSSCGCCLCAEGQQQGRSVCRGGCWAAADAGVGGHFISFTFSWSYPVPVCGPPSICSGDIEIYDNGTILHRAYGSLDGQGTIVLADLVTARGIFEEPELVALLDAPQPDCTEKDGRTESMKLVDSSGTHEKTTIACTDAPIQGAENEVQYLAATYLHY